MQWYGLKNQNFIKNFNNKKSIFKIRLKKSSFLKKTRIGYKLFSNFLYLPTNWHFILLKKKNKNFRYLYIYSENYFFVLPFLNKFLLLKFDYQLNCFIFNFFFKNNFYFLFWNYFKLIFYSFSKIFFCKLKFKGKGYYIYKNYRNTITHQFGHSHRVYIYAHCVTVKFLSKTTVFLFGSSKRDIFSIGHQVQRSKYINVFTGLGVRFARQVIYKKTGKVSTYR